MNHDMFTTHVTAARWMQGVSRGIAALSIMLLTSSAWGETTVSPAGFATTEGNGLAAPTSPFPAPGEFPPANGFRVHELHSSDVFPDHSVAITRLALRPDQSVTAPVSFTWDLTLNLSTTPRDSLSDTFAENYGTNSQGDAGFTTVLSRINEARTDGVREGDTHGFDYVFELDSPYFYDPSAGNLLAEWFIQPTSTGQPSWQDVQQSNGLVELKFAISVDATNAIDGLNAISVTQFTFVPEPTAMMLLSMGLIGCLTVLRRGRYNNIR